MQSMWTLIAVLTCIKAGRQKNVLSHYNQQSYSQCIYSQMRSLMAIYIIIRNCNPFCAFPAYLHLQIHMPTSSYLPASAKSAVTFFRQIVTLRWKPCRYRTHGYGPFGKDAGRSRIAPVSHNDVTDLCWHAGAIFVLLAELGLRKPPSGNSEGLALLGECPVIFTGCS